jgi:hypothetical protein
MEAVWRRTVRRRFRAQIRSTDVFFVTYPRSGTTWLAFMIGQALKRDPDELLTIATLDRYVAEANGAYFFGEAFDFEQLPAPRFFRVHAQYDPRFPLVVYVLRDPRDTLVSGYHFERMNNAEFDLSMHDYVVSYPHWPCAWDEHVEGWLAEPSARVLTVRYEQLHLDPAGELARVLEFAGVQVSPERLSAAVDASRFDAMRASEDRFGRGRPNSGTGQTIRRGKVGGWRDELDPDALRTLESRYGALMAGLGYEPVTT